MTKTKPEAKPRKAVRVVKLYAYTLAASGLVTTLVHAAMEDGGSKHPIMIGE